MSWLAFASPLLRNAAALMIVKATVVLALASAAAVAAKGFSAARRHMLWLVALSSCVWLVLSSPVVPAIVIHAPLLARSVVATPAPSTARVPNVGRPMIANTSRVRERFPNTHAVRRWTLQSMPLPSHPFIALWIIGCVALLVRHAAGFVGATRLARRASVATDDETTRAFARINAVGGVRREVRLRYSAEVRTPITFGVAKPYVLLPIEARSWSIERCRAVLVHETAHIARGDWLSQAIGRLACDLFWFHPLVWRAFTHLRDEAEQAADDCVLGSGMPACDYATHLLELARRTSSARPHLVAIGIVSTNDLERRFVAMFDIKRSRTIVRSRVRAITTSVALAMVCPLASVRVASPVPLHATARKILALPHTSMPVEPGTARVATLMSDTSRVSHTASLRAEDVHSVNLQPPTLETGQPAIPAADSTPSAIAIVHPNLSGKWTQDTVTGPTVESSVTDSTIITQSANTISFDSRGHVQGAPTYSRFPSVSFDGSQSTGVTGNESAGTRVAASAVWVADTLVLTTYAVVYVPGVIRDFLTYERMTLSPDGNTLLIANRSFVDGKSRWDGPRTFVLRRIAP
ncbi:MAG TPA: M56 family metallopeptidase [Gemmatimonadaceae bacterium]|nr:M56 family metallopeptidase [Gemmatimonadaceae bacterium]